jgi:hypothetical protein
MYKGYDELERLKPEEYLNWRNFDTPFDTINGGVDSYWRGIKQGRETPVITIAINGTWGATGNNTSITSYEGIGYHANTSSLLRGFLDSGARIEVYRKKEYHAGGESDTIIPWVNKTVIKEGKSNVSDIKEKV